MIGACGAAAAVWCFTEENAGAQSTVSPTVDLNTIVGPRTKRTGLILPINRFAGEFDREGQPVFGSDAERRQYTNREKVFSKYVQLGEKLSEAKRGIQLGDLYGAVGFELTLQSGQTDRGDIGDVLRGLAEAVRDVLLVASKEKGSFQLSLAAYSVDSGNKEKLEGKVSLVSASYENKKLFFIPIKKDLKDQVTYSGSLVSSQEISEDFNRMRIALSITHSDDRSLDSETFDALIQIDKTLGAIRLLPISGAAPEVIAQTKALLATALQKSVRIEHESSELLRFAYVAGDDEATVAPRPSGRRWFISVRNANNQVLKAKLDVRLTTLPSRFGADEQLAPKADAQQVISNASMTLNDKKYDSIRFMKEFYDDQTKVVLKALEAGPLKAQPPDGFPYVPTVCRGIRAKLEDYFSHRDAVWIYWAFVTLFRNELKGNPSAAEACVAPWQGQFSNYKLPEVNFK